MNQPTINWGLITDGGVFESLVHCLLHAKDDSIMLFGRPGKDSGQDARSSDGKIIYQAKFTAKGMEINQAVSKALEELEKIKKYRAPDHANFKHWQAATTWVMIANLLTNPNDRANWDTTVVPAFQAERLSAQIWGQEELEAELAHQPLIREAFFSGVNRVFMGLSETREYLAPVDTTGESNQKAIIGRQRELGQLADFLNLGNPKRILPVVGVDGMGKTRFLYESLFRAAEDHGYRVFWGLPESMALSDTWFKHILGNTPTLVALDEPPGPSLIKAFLEQMGQRDRNQWKLIVSSRSELDDGLRSIRTHTWTTPSIQLKGLTRDDGRYLLGMLLETDLSKSPDADHWNRIVDAFGGSPGWLCLYAQLSKSGEDIQTLWGAAEQYLHNMMHDFDEPNRVLALTLLQWISLWGDWTSEVQEENRVFTFLEGLGIPRKRMENLLGKLQDYKLVRKRGRTRAKYQVEPSFLRWHILLSWLVKDEGAELHGDSINQQGNDLVERIVKGEIPREDDVIHSLANLAVGYLTETQQNNLLTPIFRKLGKIVETGTLIDCSRVVQIIRKAGWGDPERALEILQKIRTTPKPNEKKTSPVWGESTFTHQEVVKGIPWVLYQIAEQDFSREIGRKFLLEFQALAKWEEAKGVQQELGQSATQLVQRLLQDPRKSGAFFEPAFNLAKLALDGDDFSPFANALVDCLLNPRRRYDEWVPPDSIRFCERHMSPSGSEWESMRTLRQAVFDKLKSTPPEEFHHRVNLWRFLWSSHQEFHRVILSKRIHAAEVQAYRQLLISDFDECLQILPKIDYMECRRARGLWSWYLDYGDDEELKALAQQCENLFVQKSVWPLQDFFSFEPNPRIQGALTEIANKLLQDPDGKMYLEFFSEVHKFFGPSENGRSDMAYQIRIAELADRCAVAFTGIPGDPPTGLGHFICHLLEKPFSDDTLEWEFTIRLCKRHLKKVKDGGDLEVYEKTIREFLWHFPDKGKFIWGVYSNAHPDSNGPLSTFEFDLVVEQGGSLEKWKYAYLLGNFTTLGWAPVKPLLERLLDETTDILGASKVLNSFFDGLYMTALRYNWQENVLPIKWIFDQIIERGLDGNLFQSHHLEWLCSKKQFKMDVRTFLELMKSREKIRLGRTRSHGLVELPFDFDVLKWCQFSANEPGEQDAFQCLCSMVFENHYLATDGIPRFVALLDPDGSHVLKFVSTYLEQNRLVPMDSLVRLAYLDSEYDEASPAWSGIATLICERARDWNKDDRYYVYFGLSRKSTGVMMTPMGQIPEYYTQRLEKTRELLQREPEGSSLAQYRRWAFQRASKELDEEMTRIEVDLL